MDRSWAALNTENACSWSSHFGQKLRYRPLWVLHPYALGAQGRDLFAGELILAMAFLSILITAPLGAISIKWAADNCLD